jgi:predicted DNA-binding transcriptional regulator YafY
VSDNETSRISRLIALLTHLQSKRLLTSTELAKKFNVSIRTIYRDIKTLEQAGVPLATVEGKGYSLLEGYRLPPIMFTENEANALITAQRLVLVHKDTSLIKHYDEAITKIKSVLRSQAKDKAALLLERIAFWENPDHQDVASNFLSTIQTALTNFSVIKIDYYSPNNDEITERHIEPFALISKVGESWYLIAWCRLRKDYRLFRFDRIRKIEITDDNFSPHTISLQAYLESYRKNNF